MNIDQLSLDIFKFPSSNNNNTSQKYVTYGYDNIIRLFKI